MERHAAYAWFLMQDAQLNTRGLIGRVGIGGLGGLGPGLSPQILTKYISSKGSEW